MTRKRANKQFINVIISLFVLINLLIPICHSRENPELSATSLLQGLRFPVPARFQAGQFRSPFENTNLGNANKTALTPLQAYPLSMLRFVGIIEKGNMRFAFILTPDNKVYSISKGDILGDHYGKVVNITKQKIDIMEETSEGNSKMPRMTTLQLKEKQ